MHLALLAGANPKKCASTGPQVRLRKGSWHINYSGLKDSILLLKTNMPRPAPQPDEINIYEIQYNSGELVIPVDHPVIASIEWKFRGTEQSVNIFASIVKD